MKDFLAPVIQTSLDLHFGRLDSLEAPPENRQHLVSAAAALARRITESILDGTADGALDTAIQRHIFTKDKTLPPWLVNRGLVVCDNDRQKLEATVRGLLKNGFNRRRFLDHLSNELIYHCWNWSPEDEKRHFAVRCVNDMRENGYCLELNTLDYVIKLGDNVVLPSGHKPDVADWYMRSIGTITLIDFSAKPVFDFTARLLEAKYKTTFILDVFKELFIATCRQSVLDRYGVLVMGEIPKIFALSDYRDACAGVAAPAGGSDAEARPLELLRRILDNFDRNTVRHYPESRFRLGIDPPQSLASRVAAMVWLRRTLARVKTVQQKKAAPGRGLQVAERTMLLSAQDQKSIVYFSLFDDPSDMAINPCHIRAVAEDSMVVQSPRGNRLNDAGPGQDVHGYFAVVGTNKKSTYCDFRSTVLAVRCPDASHCLVEISIPAAFELTRRTHKRLSLDPAMIGLFELSSPAPNTEAGLLGNLEKWPVPFCIIPDQAGHCRIKDLSAGGLMIEIHHDAPAYGYFVDSSRNHPLLALIHLTGRPNTQPLKLGLRLEAKRIRDFPPLRKKYVGFQFTEAGEVRNDRLVRFAPVGKDGLFLINDWIFRNGATR
ncbi:PilZ domain-containing protein [Solidesulfovibrio sp.]